MNNHLRRLLATLAVLTMVVALAAPQVMAAPPAQEPTEEAGMISGFPTTDPNEARTAL